MNRQVAERTASKVGPISTSGCNDLPDACLEVIFAHVPFRERLLNLPFVCKRWSKILQQPSVVWETIRMKDLKIPKTLGETPAAQESMMRWFAKRGAAIHHLHVNDGRLFDIAEDVLFFVMPHVAPSLLTLDTAASWRFTRAALCYIPQCTKLKNLQLELVKKTETFVFSILSLLPNSLTRLEISSYFHEPMDQFPSAIIELTHLQTLVVSCRELPNSMSALINLNDLSVDRLAGSTFPNVVLCLHGLQSLKLEWKFQSTASASIPQGINMLSSLSSLSFECFPAMERHNGDRFQALSTLTGLTSLALKCCKMTDIPCWISSLPRLQHLNLDDNMIATLPVSLLGCTKLTSIQLINQTLPQDGPRHFNIPEGITVLTQLQTLIASDQTCTKFCTKFRVTGQNNALVTVYWPKDWDEDWPHTPMETQRVSIAYDNYLNYEPLHAVLAFLSSRLKY